MIRIVVSIDVDTDDPAVAYRRVVDALNLAGSVPADGITWESTDEWFDEAGEELSETVIWAARRATLEATT